MSITIITTTLPRMRTSKTRTSERTRWKFKSVLPIATLPPASSRYSD